MTTPLEGKLNVATFEYDFSVDGGAIGAITMRGGEIPSGAKAVQAYINNPTTDITSGGSATISFGLNAAGDVHAADAIADINAGPIISDQITLAGAPLVMAARKQLIATIAVAALTAGKFTVDVFWWY